MIQEKDSEVQTRYIFVKAFKWLHPGMTSTLAGHPLTGRVYKAIYNINTNFYKLLLPDHTVLEFDRLVNVQEMFESELVEITLDNILDLDIREEDLDVFLEDRQVVIEDVGLSNLKTALHKHDEAEEDAADRSFYSMMELWHVNPTKFEIMLQLADYLTETDIDSLADPANYLRLHPEKGMALNIGPVLRSLDVYASDNRRASEDVSDLFIALEGLITEFERKMTNDLID